MSMHTFEYNNIKVQMNDADSSYYSGNFRRKEFYENEFLNYVTVLNLRNTYLDIGTNIANHLVYFSMFTNAEKVFGFEPINAYRNIAIDNLKRNELSNIAKIYPDALSDSCGTTVISIDGRSQSVELKKLDDHEVATSDISFMKIDVEGMEASVLRGARKTIQRNRPILFLEVIQNVGDEEYSLGDIKTIIDELEYVSTGRAFNFQPTLEFIPKERLEEYNGFAKQHDLPFKSFRASNSAASAEVIKGNLHLSVQNSSASWFGLDLSNFEKCESAGDFSLREVNHCFLELEAYPENETKFYIVVNTYKSGKILAQTKKYINRRCFTQISGANESEELRVFIYVESGSISVKKISLTTF